MQSEVERYLRTGETDPYMAAWPGAWSERAQRSRQDLRTALVQEVDRTGSGLSHQVAPVQDPLALVRGKVRPMVDGLFPLSERGAVMAILDHSVVLVTSENIERLLLEQRWDRTAWNLANLHLASLGAELLGRDAERLVGLSEETTATFPTRTSRGRTRSLIFSFTRSPTSSTTASAHVWG